MLKRCFDDVTTISVIGVIGRRSVSVATRPNALHAHFTGIGLGSTNSLLCNGIRRWLIARLGKLPFRRQFAHVSHIARRYVSRNGNHAMTTQLHKVQRRRVIAAKQNKIV